MNYLKKNMQPAGVMEELPGQLLLQIAHMLHQLMVKSDLFSKLQRKFILLETQAWPEKTKIPLAAMADGGYHAATLSHRQRLCQTAGRIVPQPNLFRLGNQSGGVRQNSDQIQFRLISASRSYPDLPSSL
jgi:hypothetical protein